MENLSPEDSALVRFLGDVIEKEIDLPDGQTDMELVQECGALMTELLNAPCHLTDEEIQQRFEALKKRIEKDERGKKTLPRFRKRLAVCAAAVIVLIGCTVGAYAYSPSFQDWIHKTLALPIGGKIEEDGVTFIREGEPKVYPDMETLMKEEGLENILYPKELPEGVKIESVTYHGKQTEAPSISIRFSDPSLSFWVDLHQSSMDLTNADLVETVGNMEFAVRDLGDKINAVTIYDDKAYYIEAPIMETVERLIKGFAGGVQ